MDNLASKTTTIDYIGPFVYQNDTLQFIGQEEGRIRPATPGNIDTFYYDYFEKDHLGNVRVVLTDELKLDQYPALSFEGASGDEVTNQDNYWENSSGNSIDITSVRTTRPGNFGNSTTNGSYTMLVRKSTGSVGATKLLKVMSGDRIHVKLDYYYTATNSNNSTANGLNAFLSSIVSAITGSSSASPILKDGVDDVSTALGSSTAISGFFSPESSSTGGSNNPPKAYLHVLLFDERFNFDADHSFVQQVAYSPNTKGTIDKTLGNAVNVNKNGYAYIYFSNESDEMVYFDNFLLTHERGPLLEETHYYPFGLTMAGISSKALNFGDPKNTKEFNGIEHTTDLDLNQYDAFYRTLDPQVGRLWQIDPEADLLGSYSPYESMGNNPISNVDPLGDFRTRFGAWWYKLWHGGHIGQNAFGEWYVSKNSSSSSPDGSVTVMANITYGKGRNRSTAAGERYKAEIEEKENEEQMLRLGVYQRTSQEDAKINTLNLAANLLLPNIIKGATGVINAKPIIPKGLSKIISIQKQARHVAGTAGQGKGFLNSIDDAQAVLDAVHSGKAEFLGTSKAGYYVYKVNSVTGTNVNLGVGITGQPTNVFMIKGTVSPSVVPTSPLFKP